jgi:AcrR family transcriptional regulator
VGERTGEPMITAVLRLVSREGAASVTTRKIAREAGVHLSAVHHQFGSKKGVLMAALEETTDLMVAALLPEPPDGEQRRRGIADLLAPLADLLDQEPCLPLVRCELLLYFRNDQEYEQRSHDQQQRYLIALGNLDPGVVAGIQTSTGCQSLALLAAGVIDGLALERASSEAFGSAGEGWLDELARTVGQRGTDPLSRSRGGIS